MIELDRQNRKLIIVNHRFPQYNGRFTLFADQVEMVESIMNSSDDCQEDIENWLDQNGSDLLDVKKD